METVLRKPGEIMLGNLQEKVSKFFKPFQNVVIDESLVISMDKLFLGSTIPILRFFFFFVNCDCELGYCIDLVIYTGSHVNINMRESLAFSAAVVKQFQNHLQSTSKGTDIHRDIYSTVQKCKSQIAPSQPLVDILTCEYIQRHTIYTIPEWKS